MGRTEKRELISRLTVLLLHLLKSALSARVARRQLGSEHSRADATGSPIISKTTRRLQSRCCRKHSYRPIATPRWRRVAEIRLPGATFPQACPWSEEQVLDAGGFGRGKRQPFRMAPARAVRPHQARTAATMMFAR